MKWEAVLSSAPKRAGNYRFSFNLLGLIPLKQMQVNVIPPLRLAPSGHSIGVRLSERGVIIAGLDSVQTSSGPAEPARDSGFKVGAHPGGRQRYTPRKPGTRCCRPGGAVPAGPGAEMRSNQGRKKQGAENRSSV